MNLLCMFSLSRLVLFIVDKTLRQKAREENFCNIDGGHAIANIKAICLIVVNISLGDYTWLT